MKWPRPLLVKWLNQKLHSYLVAELDRSRSSSRTRSSNHFPIWCFLLKILCIYLFFFIFYFIYLFIFTLQYCVGFAIHQQASATGVHVFPILNPPSHLPPHTIPLVFIFLMTCSCLTILVSGAQQWFDIFMNHTLYKVIIKYSL